MRPPGLMSALRQAILQLLKIPISIPFSATLFFVAKPSAWTFHPQTTSSLPPWPGPQPGLFTHTTLASLHRGQARSLDFSSPSSLPQHIHIPLFLGARGHRSIAPCRHIVLPLLVQGCLRFGLLCVPGQIPRVSALVAVGVSGRVPVAREGVVILGIPRVELTSRRGALKLAGLAAQYLSILYVVIYQHS